MELLSDHLRATRDALREKGTIGLFFLPGRFGSLLKRFNTLIRLAENQEEELRIALANNDTALTRRDVETLPTGTILRFPTRLVIVTSAGNGGDAA